MPQNTSAKPLAYAIFHLNLMYSSIEEESRAEVVRKCYWPLLEMAAQPGIRLGIEAPGLTLELIHGIDPAWTVEFARLLAENECELVGSGYSQVIGPLVPAKVNEANLRLGHETYERLLGCTPTVGYLNELAYSAGMLEHYSNAGFRAVVMEWENPYGNGRGWSPKWRFFPQRAVGAGDAVLPVIWVHSNSFQKFQRYVHGELEAEEYLACLRHLTKGDAGCIPVYGNDAEIFDFRPGRFIDEPLHRSDEWQRIRTLLLRLEDDAGLAPATPTEILSILGHPLAGKPLMLECSERPVPTKKQMHYNITRWAVTGRHDSAVNAMCRDIHNRMLESGRIDDETYRRLLYAWSSDFRTHITKKRWGGFLGMLSELQRDLPELPKPSVVFSERGVAIKEGRRDLCLETDKVGVQLLPWKGLAAGRIVFPQVSNHAMAGTLEHGYYDDITHLADFFTGHAEWEPPGRNKITDLRPVKPVIEKVEQGVRLSYSFCHAYGEMRKFWIVPSDEARLYLGYEFLWTKPPTGALRLGHVTLLPKSLDADGLFFRTHNGGFEPEWFSVDGQDIDHGRHVSLLTSAENALGMTEGYVEVGDSAKLLRVSVVDGNIMPVAMVTHQRVASSQFFRLSFSVLESDDTRANGTASAVDGPERIVFSIEARERLAGEEAFLKAGKM